MEPLQLQHLIYPRLLTGFVMLVYFTNLSLIEFQVRYLTLLLFFSVLDDLKWFLMASLHKNIQLILELLMGPFLVLHFSYYTLIIFLMMLSVMLCYDVIGIYADDTTLYSKCDQACNL